jgi:outer membrane protein assembly factor BamB
MIEQGLILAVVHLLGAAAPADDWPMWRCDAARSGASPGEIAPNPTLLWSRKLPPVRQAWPLEPERRLNFDASYEPVILGKFLFLGSPNDGTVSAYDTDSGEEKWTFATEGPVRCAPACSNGRVYVGSDDGYLYCLDARTGRLEWKFRGAPADRPERRQIGNGHLVSFWPVRGGPVVVADTVYFAAGVWSIFGVFVHALDAGTGKEKWSNGDLNYVITRVPACDKIGETGLSPQGHLVAIGDRLVVPNGRALPAGLDLATGRLIYFLPGVRGGDSRVAAHGGFAFVGRDRALNLYDFRDVGCRWAYKGAEAPKGYDQDSYGHEVGLCETLYLPSKSVDACDAYSAFADGIAYGLAKGSFYAFDLSKAEAVDAEFPFYGRKVKALTWKPSLLWQHATSHSGKAGTDSSGVIKAGSRVYGTAGRKLLALENLKGEPRIAWEKDIEGTATSLVAADRKLFIATAEGVLYCFGQGNPGRTFEGKPTPLVAEPGAGSQRVGKIVEATGVKSGYCLVLGLTDGRLVEELLKQTDLLVIAVDADPAKTAPLRRRWQAAGLLGSRVELFSAEPFGFLFPPYLASLIVSEDARAAGFPAKADAAKLFNVLRPYGGTLCLDLTAEDRPGFETWARGADAANAVLKTEGGQFLLVREGALPGSAPWAHEFGDAARTLCSQDDLVKAPLGILWYGDAAGVIQWKSTPNRTVVSGGRLFALEGHSGSYALRAYDVYTGRLIWHVQGRTPTDGQLRMAAMGDRLYVNIDGECRFLDAATGEAIKVIKYNAAGETAARDLRVDGDVIVLGCGDYSRKDVYGDLWWQQVYSESSTCVCIDRKSGAELWRRKARDRFGNAALVLGAGLVFCVDSIPPHQREREARKGDAKEQESTLLALDPRTGTTVWSKSLMYENRLFGNADWLAYSDEAGVLVGGRYNLVSAWDAKSGKPLWEKKAIECRGPMIIRGKTLIAALPFKDTCSSEVEYDLMTGERTSRQSVIDARRQREGCGYATGSRHLLTQRDSSASYIDLENGKMYSLRNIRSGCVNLLTAADGVLNAPNMGTGCVCSYPLATSFAMLHMPEAAAWAGTTPLIAVPPPAKPAPKLVPK